MLIRLVRTYLQPYRGWLAIIVGLQFVATVATLTLPNLNADIIDQGVTAATPRYIIRTGGVMLAVAVVQVACTMVAVWFSARAAMAYGRDSAPRSSTASAPSRRARCSSSGRRR